MAMDLPQAVNTVVRWFPPTALARLLVMSMSNGAPPAEYGIDLALVLVPAGIILLTLAWQIDRSQ
jgi:hypothetical protein